MYIAASINLIGQRGKSTGQMPKLAKKCPVTDCYYEHWGGAEGDRQGGRRCHLGDWHRREGTGD